MAFPVLLMEWIDWLRNVRKVSPHTVEAYEGDLKQFWAFQNSHYGKDLTVEDLLNLSVRDFRAWLVYRSAEEYEHRSTARALSVVRSFYKFLTKHGHPPCVALASIRSPRLKIGLPRPLSIDQARSLVEDIGDLNEEPWIGSRNQALFTLLYSSGLRLGEALGLTRKQAPLESDILLVHGKGKRERLVPILPIIQQTLQDYIRLCPYVLTPDGPLFVGAKGKRLDPAIAQKAMRHYRRAVGLPESATPHALRHSCATHLMGASGDLRGIQELLGHASLATTQVYTDIDATRLMKIYENTHPRAKIEKKPSKE